MKYKSINVPVKTAQLLKRICKERGIKQAQFAAEAIAEKIGRETK